MDYGPRDNAKEVVIAWLVDDGSAKRAHRNSILKKDLLHLGIAHGPHKEAEHCVVAVFAAQVLDPKAAKNTIDSK